MKTLLQLSRSLELKDRITIVISIIALLFSGIALGFSGFTLFKQYHPSIDLRIYGSNFGARPTGEFAYYPYVDLTIEDTGNTPTVVISVASYFVDPDRACNETPPKNWIGVLLNDKYFPAISYPIRPGEANSSRIYFAEYKVNFPDGVWVIAKTPCVEIGTINVHHQESWKTLTLGTIWFGASNPYENPKIVDKIASATIP
jgi:hypothetical protein